MSEHQEKGRKAWDALAEYHGFVLQQAYRAVSFPDLAEDVAQQVCADFLAKADRWDLEKDPRPLLKKMVQHRALSAWRERAKLLPENLQKIGLYIQQAQNTDDTVTDERLEALQSCMQKLLENERALLKRYYFDNASTKQIAGELQKNVNAVKQAIHRIREKLWRCIEKTLKADEYHGWF